MYNVVNIVDATMLYNLNLLVENLSTLVEGREGGEERGEGKRKKEKYVR